MTPEDRGTTARDATREADVAESAGAERSELLPLSRLRETRPAHCPNCGADTWRHSNFCPSCRSYVHNTWVGRLASTGRRFIAAALDGSLKDVGTFGAMIWTSVMPHGVAMTVIGFLTAVYWLGTLYLWTRGTTPGKRLLRMSVITEDGEPASFMRMAGRETIGKWISTAVFGLGLLAIPLSRDRQGWHDRMFDTWVVVDEE